MREASSTAKKSAPKQGSGFSAEERAAMKSRAKELKAASSREDLKQECLAAIAAMPPHGRDMAERIHVIIAANAPGLQPKTWYGMPAYANDEGKVVCYIRGAEKFKERYMTFGFNESANLDDGHLWPIAYALTELTAADEKRLADFVKKAVS